MFMKSPEFPITLEKCFISKFEFPICRGPFTYAPMIQLWKLGFLIGSVPGTERGIPVSAAMTCSPDIPLTHGKKYRGSGD